MGKEEGEGTHLSRQGSTARGRGEAQELVRRFGLTTNKRLGQHFLVSDKVVAAILSRTNEARGVLEIGPGIGVLTRPLCDACDSVTVIELDTRFIEVLREVAPLATIMNADVLKTDLRNILSEMDEPRCIVSNMPYNITGPLLGKVSECRSLIRNAVLMMQKEVGDRVIAKPGTSDRGALSVSMQLQFEIKKVCDAKAGAFSPPPKVDSIVLDFRPINQECDLDKVLRIVRTGFTQPRKTLANNLAERYGRERIELPPNVRPHQLTNEQWTSLAERL